METSEIQSILIPDTSLSDDYGVLALCQMGKLPPHAFVAFEYLTPSTNANGTRERLIKRLDFRPDGMVNCIIGRGKTTQANVTDATLTKLKTGPFWRLKIEDVLQVPGFKNTYDTTDDANELLVDDLDTEVYSSAGDSVKSFFHRFKKKVGNCMTFSRGYIVQYRRDLGISETKEELDKMMNLKWVPIQLPSMLVPIYKKHQCENA